MRQCEKRLLGDGNFASFGKGTGDGLFPKSFLEQKKIRMRGRGDLIRKDTENPVSSVPRTLPNAVNPASFKQHLSVAAFAHPFARDFASDALDDADMPAPATWSELKAYLTQCGACRGAIVGAAIAWRSYRKRHPPSPRPPAGGS